MNRTPATAATGLGPRKAGGRAASGSARSGNVFPVGAKEKKLKLDDAWYWKHDERKYEHIMALEREVLAKIIPIPHFTSVSPRLKGDARHATSSPKNASTVERMRISLEIARNPS